MRATFRNVDWQTFGGLGYDPRPDGPPRHLCECRHLHLGSTEPFLSVYPTHEGEDPARVALRAAVAHSGVFHPTEGDQEWLTALLGLAGGDPKARQRVIRETFQWLDGLHRRPWLEHYRGYTDRRVIGGLELEVPVSKRAIQEKVYYHVKDALEENEVIPPGANEKST